LDDAEFVVIGYGTAGRVALSAVRSARAEGIPVGLLRPITLSPYPFAKIAELANQAHAFLVVEMNTGQMLCRLGFMDVWEALCHIQMRY